MKYAPCRRWKTPRSAAFRFGALTLLGGLFFAGSACGFGRQAEEKASAMASPGFSETLPGFPHIAPPTALEGPLRIGIQPGHWRVEELPDELARLRTSTGAAFGALRELDLNLAVSKLLVDRLRASGYAAELIPAAVPAGYRADLFVSVHADRTDRPDRQGWKLAPPWRPNRRSRELADAVSAAFRETGLPEDINGVTANMRGYFGFSWWRFENALSPYTPAVLVEMGFMGNAADRARMLGKPDLYAAALHSGIEAFLKTYSRGDLDALRPVLHRARYAGAAGTAARAAPNPGASVLERYDPGRRLMPVDTAGDGWFEVFSRPLRRGVWVHESELD